MKWLRVIQTHSPQHKYEINSQMLGDAHDFAWSNLGYWSSETKTYPQACRQLAIHLAAAVHLNSNDRVLDLGCGKGASLLLWQQEFKVSYIEAVELQAACVHHIQQKIKFIQNIQQGSFLNLNPQHFKFKFDVILCIDAAYHSDLNLFLKSIYPILNSKGRIGFHTLMLTPKFQTLSKFEKLKLAAVLKCADVELAHLMSEQQLMTTLRQYGFESIDIEPLGKAVLAGFSRYIQQSLTNQLGKGLDRFKIEMTGKLCRKLYDDGIVEYVQLSAVKA